MSHKGSYTRGYLPHRDYPDSLQAITFRLADSIPRKVIDTWRQELAESLESPDAEHSSAALSDLHRRIARYEDDCRGSCLLADPGHAEILQKQLIQGHRNAYLLIAWCIMPNHVHVLIRLRDIALSKVVASWKGASAFAINRAAGRNGKLWERDYFDRAIHSEEHFHRSVRYIHRNPVKAGLCRTPEVWPFSSAGVGWDPT